MALLTGDRGARLDELLRICDRARRGAWLAGSRIHGERHWQCVACIGARLARESEGADVIVALLFGILHDCRRENDGWDPGHGARAAALAAELHDAGRLTLADGQLERLRDALTRHDDGSTTLDPVIGACWDADRLCLPRVGIEPRLELLSTALGRTCPAWARTLLNEPLREWRELLAGALADGR